VAPVAVPFFVKSVSTGIVVVCSYSTGMVLVCSYSTGMVVVCSYRTGMVVDAATILAFPGMCGEGAFVFAGRYDIWIAANSGGLCFEVRI
jgi:hypothetical protein